MNSIQYVASLFICTFFSSYCIAEEVQQLGIDKVCAEKYLNNNDKQLCTNELLEKAKYVNKKFLLHAGSLNSYTMLKELNSTVLKFNADRSTCNLYENEKYVSCINKALDIGSESIDEKNASLSATDINSLNIADLINSAHVSVTKIVDNKLNELNVCRIAYANKLDDNISAVSDVASAIQAKCNYLASEFYNYSLLLNLSSAYDPFQIDYMDFATRRMFVDMGVEKHFGQQTTTALVLEQRANRKASATKNKKPKTNKKINI